MFLRGLTPRFAKGKDKFTKCRDTIEKLGSHRFTMRFVILVSAAIGFGIGILFSQTVLKGYSDSADLPIESEYTTVSICDEVLANLPQDEIEVFTGKPAEVDFSSNPEAYLFRTTIREQAAKGPDFAGHFTIAAWGCGVECQGYAIIDAITGKVVVYEPYMKFHVAEGLSGSVDSSILTLNPKYQDYQDNAFLKSQIGRPVADVARGNPEAEKARIYYQLYEHDGGASLRTVCVENHLDGTF